MCHGGSCVCVCGCVFLAMFKSHNSPCYVIILLLFVWSNMRIDLTMTNLVSIGLPFINEVSVIESGLPRLDQFRLSVE